MVFKGENVKQQEQKKKKKRAWDSDSYYELPGVRNFGTLAVFL